MSSVFRYCLRSENGFPDKKLMISGGGMKQSENEGVF